MVLLAKERPSMAGNAELGARIKQRREWLRKNRDRSLIQAELGRRLVPPQGQGTVSDWETGKTDVPTYLLQQIADVLQTTVHWLLGVTDIVDLPEERLQRRGIDPDETLPGMDESIREAVATIIEQLGQRSVRLPEPEQGRPTDAPEGDEEAAGTA